MPAEGKYTNCLRIGHNAFQFLLEFGQSYSDEDTDLVHTRLIMNPVFATRLAKLLADTITEYESTFGPIPNDHETR